MSQDIEKNGYFYEENFKKLTYSNDILYKSLNISRLDNSCYYDSSLIKINDICNNHITNYLSLSIYNFYNNFVISKVINIHLMYMFILDVDLTKLNLKKSILNKFEKRFGHLRLILTKIGYTYHLLDRIQALKKKFKCNVYLIGLKQVNSEHDETEFHKILKDNYPELFEKLYIETDMSKKLDKDNVKDKVLSDETYIFNEKLLQEFFNYKVVVKDDLAIEKEKTNQLDKQIAIKDKEIAIKNKDLEMKDKEIELVEKEIELVKLKIKLKEMEKTE